MNTINDDNEIIKFIDKHGIQNKDSTLSKKACKKSPPSRRKYLRQRKVIDLHGKTSDEAVVILRNLFQNYKRKGFTSLLIVHGKGYNSAPNDGPILKKLVFAMLDNEFSNVVKDYKAALPRDGGSGATLVRLK